MMTVATGIDLHPAELAAICRRYGVKELCVFGSVARGEAREDSDIDLLVEFQPDAKVSLIQHAAAQRELAALFGKKVDLVSKRGLNELIRDEIIAESRPIYAA
jgi:predicted nucleotidyltransferase